MNLDTLIWTRSWYAEHAEQHGEDIKDSLKHIKAVQVLHTKISKLREDNKWKVWEVYKADDKGGSWKWVARTEKEGIKTDLVVQHPFKNDIFLPIYIANFVSELLESYPSKNL